MNQPIKKKTKVVKPTNKKTLGTSPMSTPSKRIATAQCICIVLLIWNVAEYQNFYALILNQNKENVHLLELMN